LEKESQKSIVCASFQRFITTTNHLELRSALLRAHVMALSQQRAAAICAQNEFARIAKMTELLLK